MQRNLLLSIALITTSFPTLSVADAKLDGLKSRIVGTWTSISCELRPTANQTDPSAAPTPTYVTRDFAYDADGGFDAVITVFEDSACANPIVSYDFAGDITWHDPNPAAQGAYSQDYVLNRKLNLTVLAANMVEQLNALPDGSCGDGPFEIGVTRDILGKPCALLRFVEGSEFRGRS